MNQLYELNEQDRQFLFGLFRRKLFSFEHYFGRLMLVRGNIEVAKEKGVGINFQLKDVFRNKEQAMQIVL